MVYLSIYLPQFLSKNVTTPKYTGGLHTNDSKGRPLERWKRLEEGEKKFDTLRLLGFSENQIQDVKDEFRDTFLKLDKWYESVKVEYSRSRKKLKVKRRVKIPREIGKPLEDLVEIALRELGCKIIAHSEISKGIVSIDPDEFLSRHQEKPNVSSDDLFNEITNEKIQYYKDKSIKVNRVRLQFEVWCGLPSFPERGKFKNYGIIFKRHPNARHLVDFECRNIAIEVKNWDPAYPKSDRVVKEEIIDRFKKVRKKERYLLIPEASPPKGFLFTLKQRQMLKQRRIKEINYKEQLRWNNQKEVYKSLFYELERVLSIY